MASQTERPALRHGDALIVVDVQNDFLPGGRLAVPEGDKVVPALNRYLAAFVAHALPVYATRDWHPVNHCSFKVQGGPWPPHCIAGSNGAQFPPGLDLPHYATIVSKADTAGRDAYSGFEGTNLDVCLRAQEVRRVFVGGLATDYCVLNTVRDACRLGYEVRLLADAIRAVNIEPGDGYKAENEMLRLGARPVTWPDLAS
jgi:nicotinamidase/pyrazinamidase